MTSTAPLEPAPRQSITQQTAVSIGLVVVLVGGALAMLREVYGVRSEIAPQLATIAARVESMSESLAEVRRRLDGLPSGEGTAARLTLIEARLSALEQAGAARK